MLCYVLYRTVPVYKRDIGTPISIVQWVMNLSKILQPLVFVIMLRLSISP